MHSYIIFLQYVLQFRLETRQEPAIKDVLQSNKVIRLKKVILMEDTK
jgi:hypothetical protein